MKFLPTAFRTHLENTATTLCWCWKLECVDSLRLGFTDHDRNLTFDDMLFEAHGGLSSSEIIDSAGFELEKLEIYGALSSEKIDEAGLSSGRFDNARIEVWRVNWADASQRVLMRKGALGEVRRGPNGFIAEIRCLAHYLDQENGRLYQYACDAELGDKRCGIDLDGRRGWKEAGVVAAADRPWRFLSSGLESFASGHFTGGLLTWITGDNQPGRVEVMRHASSAGGASIELWRPAPRPITPGDAFTITAGCNKLFSTCRDRFANASNFRGFPHIPGNDFLFNAASGNGGRGNDSMRNDSMTGAPLKP